MDRPPCDELAKKPAPVLEDAAEDDDGEEEVEVADETYDIVTRKHLQARKMDNESIRAVAYALKVCVGESLVAGVYDSDTPSRLCASLCKLADRVALPLESI